MAFIKVNSEAFIRVGGAVHPHFTEAEMEYERLWLGQNSPFLKEGSLDLYTSEDEAARICLLKKPAETESHLRNLFCFYARPSEWDVRRRGQFFSDLEALCQSEGIETLTGPVQFSTWHPYRFISNPGTEPFFPGEQPMPGEWHADFAGAGFQSLAGYESVLVEDLEASLVLGEQMGVKKALPALELNQYEGSSFKEIAGELFSLSLKVFQNNFGYSPITLEEFSTILVDHAPPATYLVTASQRGALMGFAYSYGIGNWGGFKTPTSVLKTLGVHPEFRKLKIGYGLSYLTHKYWLEKGYARILHAYMKTDNASRSMSGHFGKAIRQYELVVKQIRGAE